MFKTLKGQYKYRVNKKAMLAIQFIDKFFSQQQQNKYCWSKSHFHTELLKINPICVETL